MPQASNLASRDTLFSVNGLLLRRFAHCSKSKWELLTGNERMNSRIFGENVKTFPKCKVIIEKNDMSS